MSDSQSLRPRMLSVEQIDQAVTEIAAAAQREGVPLLLIGGVAMSHYGSDRFTADVDFASDRALKALPVERPLSFGGYQGHTSRGVPVEWVIRTDDYEAVFSEAIRHPRNLERVEAPVVSPEYLVAMKMVARRPKDLLDVAALLGFGVVDTEKALRITKRLLGAYAADDLRSHIEEAEWRRRGRR